MQTGTTEICGGRGECGCEECTCPVPYDPRGYCNNVVSMQVLLCCVYIGYTCVRVPGDIMSLLERCPHFRGCYV